MIYFLSFLIFIFILVILLFVLTSVYLINTKAKIRKILSTSGIKYSKDTKIIDQLKQLAEELKNEETKKLLNLTNKLIMQFVLQLRIILILSILLLPFIFMNIK